MNITNILFFKYLPQLVDQIHLNFLSVLLPHRNIL